MGKIRSDQSAGQAPIPRRDNPSRFTPAETAIAGAIEAVQSLPPDPRLFAAIIGLRRALDRVADYVDGVL